MLLLSLRRPKLTGCSWLMRPDILRSTKSLSHPAPPAHSPHSDEVMMLCHGTRDAGSVFSPTGQVMGGAGMGERLCLETALRVMALLSRTCSQGH